MVRNGLTAMMGRRQSDHEDRNSVRLVGIPAPVSMMEGKSRQLTERSSEHMRLGQKALVEVDQVSSLEFQAQT